MATDKTRRILTPESSKNQIAFLTRISVAVAPVVARCIKRRRRASRGNIFASFFTTFRVGIVSSFSVFSEVATDKTRTILTPESSKNQIAFFGPEVHFRPPNAFFKRDTALACTR